MMFAHAASFCVRAACAILRAVSRSGAVTSAVMHWAAGIMENSSMSARALTSEFSESLALTPPPALGLRVRFAFVLLLIFVVGDQENAAGLMQGHVEFVVGLEA